MVLFIKDNIKMEQRMVEVHSNGLMVLFMWETSTKTIFKDKENIVGKMVENMLANGKIIKWMEKEFLLGWMEDDMRVNIKMIKNMDMVNLNGLMEEFIRENGQMENNMAKESIQVHQRWKKKENGKMVKQQGGQEEEINQQKSEIEIHFYNNFFTQFFGFLNICYYVLQTYFQ
ncbi:unnamed protein product [Paramecium primaurelia]|uniref:Uncharacterized protein n=1 Tax=Paramecium primaurelia TaxID=5886 RepID=A0A8S1PEY4_PARPR|nr:unnamed protein product [Paramecium primaurelia]